MYMYVHLLAMALNRVHRLKGIKRGLGWPEITWCVNGSGWVFLFLSVCKGVEWWMCWVDCCNGSSWNVFVAFLISMLSEVGKFLWGGEWSRSVSFQICLHIVNLGKNCQKWWWMVGLCTHTYLCLGRIVCMYGTASGLVHLHPWLSRVQPFFSQSATICG